MHRYFFPIGFDHACVHVFWLHTQNCAYILTALRTVRTPPIRTHTHRCNSGWEGDGLDCTGEKVPTYLFCWQCSDDNVLMTMFCWQCSDDEGYPCMLASFCSVITWPLLKLIAFELAGEDRDRRENPFWAVWKLRFSRCTNVVERDFPFASRIFAATSNASSFKTVFYAKKRII